LTIDDYQVHELAMLLDRLFGKDNQLGVASFAIIRLAVHGKWISICHEYAFFFALLRQVNCAASTI